MSVGDLLAHAAHRLERHVALFVAGGDGHDQRVDEQPVLGYSGVVGPVEQLADHPHAVVHCLWHAGVVECEHDQRAAVLCRLRQDPLEPLGLAADRVDQRRLRRLIQRRREGERIRGVDRERRVDLLLHRPHEPPHHLGLEVRTRAGIDVEVVRAGLHLGARQLADLVRVARGNRRRHLLASAVDLLTDDQQLGLPCSL